MIERTFAAETLSITAASSVRFVARILRRGDRYGLENVLVWNEEREGVEFYDTRYPHTKFGQFVSRYYVDTILGRDKYGDGVGGLDLMGCVSDWKIDNRSMIIVRAWLNHEVPR